MTRRAILIIIRVMIKRKYMEHKLSEDTVMRLKKRAIDEKISQAELVSKAIEIYLRTSIDKRDKQD